MVVVRRGLGWPKFAATGRQWRLDTGAVARAVPAGWGNGSCGDGGDGMQDDDAIG